jgi:hypothetical protein
MIALSKIYATKNRMKDRVREVGHIKSLNFQTCGFVQLSIPFQ